MATQIGTANVIFGIIDNQLGYFESLTFEKDGEVVEVVGGNGDITAVFLTGEKFPVNGTFVLDSTATVPDRGDIITLAQAPNAISGIGDIYVTKVTEDFSNSDAVKVGFEGTHWPQI